MSEAQMYEAFMLVVAALAGVLLGGIFFGGLWWTIRVGMSSPIPALWFLGSLLLRMGITLVGFYFVFQGNWQRLVACLFGFIIARLLVTWFTRPAREAAHAP